MGRDPVCDKCGQHLFREYEIEDQLCSECADRMAALHQEREEWLHYHPNGEDHE